MSNYNNLIQNALSYCLTETNLTKGKKYRGKVRDTYDLGDQLLLITTDRQSAFDKVLASVPFKGQVLNLISAWWFEKTRHIIPNHVISIPDPNITLAKKCKVFPIEFVVRGYITGTTNTSLWTQYNQGVRHYCGHTLKEGLKKNERLETPLITPTTKETAHDRPISPEEIIAEGFMSAEEWDLASTAALRLYQFGVEEAAKRGLILVDTKYEMGLDSEGNIVLIDEVHTPDSSRYWLANSYESRLANQQEPENIDKEFLRLWFIEHCDPYHDAVLPKAPDELIVTLSSRYIQLYELILGQRFPFPDLSINPHERIEKIAATIMSKPLVEQVI
jgi:phosphoribosylaminoimidazole-succinocarboxamide synthase